jgi:hypothetical protein
MRAVLERDLVAQGTRPRAFLVRGIVAAGAAFMVFAGILGTRWSSGYLETRTFQMASWIALLSLVLLTPVASVDAVVDERIRGTLPLVLSTPEGPRGFAAGKFLSRATLAFGLFATAIPLLAVCWLFDGGPFRRLLSFTTLGAAVILECVSWSLLASAVCRRFESASLLAIALPPARWAASAWGASLLLPWSAGGAWACLGTTPVPTLLRRGIPPEGCPGGELAWLPPFLRAGPEPLYLAAAALFALFAVGATGALLAREGHFTLPAPRRLRLPFHRAVWRRALDFNPLLAKDLVGTRAVGTLLALGILAVLLAGYEIRSVSGPAGFSRAADVHITGLAWSVTASSALAAMAGATLLAQERARGTLPLLRASRLTISQILRGKVYAALPAPALAWAFGIGQVITAASVGALHPPTVVPALLAVTVLPASFGVLGIGWGLAARSPGGALSGVVAALLLSSLGCAWWLAFPLLLLARDFLDEKFPGSFFETMAFPCLVIGSPWLLVVGLLGGLERLQLPVPSSSPRDFASVWFVASVVWLVGNFLYVWWAGKDLARRLREELLREEDLSSGPTHPYSWRVWRERRSLERDERRRGVRAPSKEWKPVAGPPGDSPPTG